MGQDVSSLDRKHHQLEEKIHAEEERPYPDQFKINELKREKLRIKDLMTQAETRH